MLQFWIKATYPAPADGDIVVAMPNHLNVTVIGASYNAAIEYESATVSIRSPTTLLYDKWEYIAVAIGFAPIMSYMFVGSTSTVTAAVSTDFRL